MGTNRLGTKDRVRRYGVPCRQDGISGKIGRKTSCLIAMVSLQASGDIKLFFKEKSESLFTLRTGSTDLIGRRLLALVQLVPLCFLMGSSFSTE